MIVMHTFGLAWKKMRGSSSWRREENMIFVVHDLNKRKNTMTISLILRSTQEMKIL